MVSKGNNGKAAIRADVHERFRRIVARADRKVAAQASRPEGVTAEQVGWHAGPLLASEDFSRFIEVASDSE